MTRVILAIAFLVGSVSGPAAQQSELRFEVASIRPGSPGAMAAQRLRPGRVDIVNTPLRGMLMLAFDVKAPQLTGPTWLNSIRFDIQATLPDGAGRADVPQMLRALLTERFGLVARVEQRLVDGYELLVSEDGLRIGEVEAIDELAKDFGSGRFEDALQNPTVNDRVSETLDGPVRSMMIPLGSRTVTSRSLYSMWTAAGGTFHVDAARIRMSELAEILALNVDRPVMDKTGLERLYTFKVVLDANASAIRGLRSSGITKTVQGDPIGQPTGVSTFKAIEGLGLKLEERRVPLDFVVVEHIERTPTENCSSSEADRRTSSPRGSISGPFLLQMLRQTRRRTCSRRSFRNGST